MCRKPTAESPDQRRARLILEDGTEFQGWSFGAETSRAGEIGEDSVGAGFQTGMVALCVIVSSVQFSRLAWWHYA